MKVGGLVFASIISGVVAFEIAGAYERVFFWYAREIDIQNGRNPPRIAPNCPPPCSFNQFIAFINDPDLIPRPNLVDERVRKPEVTRTIRALIDNGLTGTYDDGRIIDKVKGTGDLIKNAVGFIKHGGGTAAQKAGVRNAINGVRFYRNLKSSDAKITKLREKWPDLDIRTDPVTMQLDDGSQVTERVINIHETIQANPDKGGAKEIESVVDKKSKSDKQHDDFKRAASDGYSKLTCQR